MKNACIEYLNNEIEYKMNLIIDNYPINSLKPVLVPLHLFSFNTPTKWA
jgi:hypothetical protein